MSLISRRNFLIGSLAATSAVLLTGCGGSSSGNDSNTSGNGGSSGGSNNTPGNNGNGENNSNSSNGTGTNNGSENVLGDLGKGYQYRPYTSCAFKDYEKNIVQDQGIGTFLYVFTASDTIDEDGYITGTLLFSIANDSEDIDVPVENPLGNLSQNDLNKLESSSNLYKNYSSKYMEVKCGSAVMQAATFGGNSTDGTSPIKPGDTGIVYLVCRLPKDWTSATIRYTMPYDTRKYANFIIYPSDSYKG